MTTCKLEAKSNEHINFFSPNHHPPTLKQDWMGLSWEHMKWGSEAAVCMGPPKPEGKHWLMGERRKRERSKQNQQNQGGSKKVRTEIPPSWEMSPRPWERGRDEREAQLGENRP